MALRGGRKLSKEEAAKVQIRGRGSLEEYEQIFGELDEGEGYTYEIDSEQKSITERSRWTAVADRQGFNFRFTTKMDRSTGESAITVVKGSQKSAEQQAAEKQQRQARTQQAARTADRQRQRARGTDTAD